MPRYQDELLPEVFAATATRLPDKIAIIFGEDRVTYGELDARANRVAHALRAKGVRPAISSASGCHARWTCMWPCWAS